MNIPSKSGLAYVLVAAVFVVMPLQHAQSAPGSLPTAPLYLSTAVEPNIFFTLDDSGSMGWSPMLPTNLGGITQDTGIYYTGIPIFNGSLRFYYNPSWHSDSSIVPPVAAYPEAWALKSKDANYIYYNPDVSYAPWAGVDGSGNPLYVDADPYNAPEDPNDWSNNTIDLTVAQDYDDGNRNCTACLYLPTYYDWVDTDGDGIPHATNDSGTVIEIKAANAPFPSGRDYTDELQNFANWFVYYRTRADTMRAGVGRVIHNAAAMRMGLDVFNRGHQVDAGTMTDDTNKLALLNSFYNISFGSTTPARRALERVGELYSGNTSNPTPIQSAADGGECQQNFNIMLSDGFWNGPSPGVGNADSDSSGVTDNGFDGDANESVDDGMYEDSYSNTLGDVAMYYYENDLSALADNVPIQPNIDEAPHQHLVTYSISFGLNGTLDPTTQDPTDAGFAWTDPASDNNHKIDDLWHAAYNSRGQYLYAQDSQSLTNALGSSLLDITSRSGISSAAASNSSRLSTDTVIYLGYFNSNQWEGNLMAFPIIDLDTGELAATPTWEAGPVLTARDIATDPREIITFNERGGVRDGTPFEWSNLKDAQKDDLKTSPGGGLDTINIGKARLAYIRGDRSDEGIGYSFRTRLSVLGDLINSGPVSVGAPSLGWPDYAPFPTGADAYAEFKNGPMASRQQMLYAGANDGMLHAFNATSGTEEFAYIPEPMFSTNVNEGLHYLTDPGYQHRYYVDSTPAVSDIFMTGPVLGGDWTTVLIGGLRGGGRGYYALDVTDPATFSEANAADIALWEFTDSDDAELGYTYSRPYIALANNGRWVAIFGNGYNNTGTGEAVLFIVDIEAGIDGTWSKGANDYQTITTKVGTLADPNGLATPAIADLDGNGTVDRVYAGDLQGNMWAFDMTDTNSNNWKSAYKTAGNPVPLFTTQNNEPITAKPVLAKHPTQPGSSSPSNAPNLMVYFGSGQYLVEADKNSTDVQSFYGVWDKGDKSQTVSSLVEQTFDIAYTGRVLTRNSVDYSLDHGWYFDLDVSGERSVTAPIARADTVFFNSWVPEVGPCDVGGFGYKFAVDMVNGGSPLEPAFDSNDDGIIDENDYQNDTGGNLSTLAAISQDGFLPEPTFVDDLAYTADEALKVEALWNIPSGRFSWLELMH